MAHHHLFSHHINYCLWDHKKSHAHKEKKESMVDAFNMKPTRQGSLFSSSASAHDLTSLDKEKEDEASPRGVLEACLNEFDSHHHHHDHESDKNCSSSRARSHWGRFFRLWKRKSFKRLASIPPISVPKMPKWKSHSTRENNLLSNLYKFKSSLVTFHLSDLRHATNHFSTDNLIGKGGFAEVYKGCLKDGQLVAVKRMTKGTTDEKTAGFLTELGVIAHVDHPNTAKLVGCCVEGEMHLVFQLSELGSLGSLLHGSDKSKLDWSKRYKITLGIADGLFYLHEHCHRRIIHRDIKAENILLTENFDPQISDFGLAKWLPEQWTHYNVTKFEGTFGYFAPEYCMHGIVDEKTDVYSFGVLLLEIITGRYALDHSQSLVLWAKPLLDANHIKDLVDPSLGDNYDKEQAGRVILTASLCVEQSPILRPRMSQVVTLLSGDERPESLNPDRKKPLQRTYSEELLDAQEYNSTKYLRDLDRHRQLALGS